MFATEHTGIGDESLCYRNEIVISEKLQLAKALSYLPEVVLLLLDKQGKDWNVLHGEACLEARLLIPLQELNKKKKESMPYINSQYDNVCFHAPHNKPQRCEELKFVITGR